MTDCDPTLTADILAALEKYDGWRNVLNRLHVKLMAQVRNDK
jgi:hypothetical protein